MGAEGTFCSLSRDRNQTHFNEAMTLYVTIFAKFVQKLYPMCVPTFRRIGPLLTGRSLKPTTKFI